MTTGPNISYSHSADYKYLEDALQARWDSCATLITEIEAFIPRPIEEYAKEREAELQRLSELNPDSDLESLTILVDGQIRARASPNMQFHLQFGKRLSTEYVLVTILSHALCEAAINAVLAIGLAVSEKEDLFSLLERADAKEKWRVGPKAFAPAYTLDKGCALYETLHHLTRQRNALVHYKVDLAIQGKTVLQGSGFNRESPVREVKWIKRFFSLPYDLVDHVRLVDPGHPLMILTHSGPIHRDPAHRGI